MEAAGVSDAALTTYGWQHFEIPHKYDVIPIHSSDRAAFRRCRRYWDWSSPTRHNFSVRADVHGVNVPMFFGTGAHFALENFYSPGLRRDPVEAFTTWFDIQWRGGIITADWLDKVYDLKPQQITPSSDVMDGDIEQILTRYPNLHGEAPLQSPLWRVRGLEDILPDPDHAEFDELRHMGIEMMKFYKKYAEINDDFTIVIAEHDFSIPIWDYENDRILKALDVREQSPNYGKYLEVHARGRQDAIYVRPNEKMGILENKTAGRWGEDELRKLESDEQCTNYLYCAEIEAQYYGLPHAGTPLEEVIYNVMRKAYPRPPTELSNGMFSVDRQNESTTYEMLQRWIKLNMPGVALSEKQKGYIEYLRDIGDEQFIVRKLVRRNRHQLANCGKRLFMETMDMLDPTLRIYPNISNSFKCLNCAFRPPCMAKEDGGDWRQLIEDNYVVARDR